jgi:hypothetical protein
MSRPERGPDRRMLLATLRDYVEQLREEGMEGVPYSVARGMPRACGARHPQSCLRSRPLRYRLRPARLAGWRSRR